MQRKQLKYPDDWEPVIQAHCEECGLTWSEFVREAIRDMLPTKVADKLSEVDSVGRPKKEKRRPNSSRGGVGRKVCDRLRRS